MEQENKVTLSLWKFLDLNSRAEQFDMVTRIFFDNLTLNHNRTELYSMDQQQLLDYLKIIKAEEYNAKLKELTSDDQSNS